MTTRFCVLPTECLIRQFYRDLVGLVECHYEIHDVVKMALDFLSNNQQTNVDTQTIDFINLVSYECHFKRENDRIIFHRSMMGLVLDLNDLLQRIGLHLDDRVAFHGLLDYDVILIIKE